MKIYIITSYPQGEIIEINPNGPLRSERVLYLTFWAEVRLVVPSQMQALLHHKMVSYGRKVQWSACHAGTLQQRFLSAGASCGVEKG
jgi:hypothetical protein